MIARGKREARRPWIKCANNREALKERNNRDDISHFQCSLQLTATNQGDALRSAQRLPLAIIFRAVGAALRVQLLPL